MSDKQEINDVAIVKWVFGIIFCCCYYWNADPGFF